MCRFYETAINCVKYVKKDENSKIMTFKNCQLGKQPIGIRFVRRYGDNNYRNLMQ